MKHQAITLLKFKSLAARLSLPLWQTVGVLESLWLFTIHHARDGDLSRFRPSDLAVWLEYSGDATALVDALVETRWLDRQGDVLVIHDWADHRPTWLKGVDARQLSSELSGQLSSELSSELSGQLSSELSSELSTASTPTKCPTKQVGLGIGTKSVTNSQGKAGNQKFKKPSLEEVAEYCRERDNDIDPQEFIDHYETNGWKRGNTQIRNWKACIHTWETRRRKEQPESRVATMADLENFDLVNGSTR